MPASITVQHQSETNGHDTQSALQDARTYTAAQGGQKRQQDAYFCTGKFWTGFNVKTCLSILSARGRPQPTLGLIRRGWLTSHQQPWNLLKRVSPGVGFAIVRMMCDFCPDSNAATSVLQRRVTTLAADTIRANTMPSHLSPDLCLHPNGLR